MADRERIIVERDAQFAAVNARLATAEGLIAERERIIVERDGQLAATNARMATAETAIAERDAQLVQGGERVEALRDEVARRAGWRWWLALPFLRIRRKWSPAAPVSHQDGP